MGQGESLMPDGSQDAQEPAKRPYHALKAIPDIDAKILDGISQGRSLQSIADEFGVHDTAILRRAQRDFPDAYKAAALTGYELRMDRRERELEAADSNVSVTRADRLLNHARWLAERSCPERWGQKQTVEHSVSPSITFVFAQAERPAIDGVAQQIGNAEQVVDG